MSHSNIRTGVDGSMIRINGAFLHDATAALLVFPSSSLVVGFFSYANAFFYSTKFA